MIANKMNNTRMKANPPPNPPPPVLLQQGADWKAGVPQE